MAAPKAPEGTIIKMRDGSLRIKRGGTWAPYSGVDEAAPGAAYFGAPGGRPKLSAQEEKALLAARDGAQKMRGVAADADRFVSLNNDVSTGGVDDWGIIGQATSLFSPKKAEMRAIGERMVPVQREAGSGAMSDRDVEMYRAATLSIDKPGPTNQALGGVLKAGSQRQGDYAAFLDFYAQRNGTLLGAEEAWGSYANANPLFDKGKTGTTIRKVTPWRQWFGVGGPGGRPAQGPAQRGGQVRAQPAPARAAPAQGQRKRYNPQTGRIE